MINTIIHRDIIQIDIHIKKISCIGVAFFNPAIQFNFGSSRPKSSGRLGRIFNNSRILAIKLPIPQILNMKPKSILTV